MSFANLIRVAITAIRANKFRTFLSTLGIIIGVAAVITMMAVGQGSKESIKKDIGKMGSNLITIRPGADMRHGGVRPDPASMQTLKVTDYEAIAAGTRYVRYVSPEVNASGQVIYGANNTTSTAYGEGLEYFDIKQWDVEEGDRFTRDDIRKSSKVCVVGRTVVKELFGDPNAPCVGKLIRFKSIPFRIVGVLKGKGYNSWGMDQDNVIIAPYTTVMKRILAQTFLNSITVSAQSEEVSEYAIEAISEKLRETHKLREDAIDDFNVMSQQEMLETMNSTMNTLTIVLVVAAAFSLLVAGIGIMNIMLVSVSERTREIGLRMSVGARGRDISRQFLIESVMISLTGGVLGIGLGYLLSYLGSMMMLPTHVPLWSVLVSFGVCVVIGLVFGIIPARKAARMDPIEALRYE